MAELFDFILDRVVFFFRPTRAAIALLGDDRVSFANVKLRRLDATESNDLAISRTLTIVQPRHSPLAPPANRSIEKPSAP